MKRKMPFGSPKQNSPRGVGFFQQFPRQFLRPYGEADKAPPVETVMKRIKPFTCEWLLRPKVALSELSDTVLKNTNVIKSHSQTILTDEFAKLFQNYLKPINKHLANLHKDSEQRVTEADVVETLKFLYQENDELDTIVEHMFHVGGALFSTATQYIIARTLVRSPEDYAEIVEAEDGSDAAFQRDKDIVSMRDFVVNSVVGRAKQRSVSSPRKNLIAAFDSPVKGESTGNFNDKQPSTSCARNFAKKTILSESTSSSSSEEELEQEQQREEAIPVKVPEKRKSKGDNHGKKSKVNPLELLAADEETSESKKKSDKKGKGKGKK